MRRPVPIGGRPIYHATDYRRAILAELQALGLLQRDLARALDRSEGWLSLVLSGRKSLDPQMVDAVGELLGLDASALRYLGALVDLENPSRFARTAAWASVQAIQQQIAALKTDESYVALYESWYVQAVSELARCEGFRSDPVWIASVLQPEITVEQAEYALTCLLGLGLLAPDGEGGLATAQPSSFTPSIVPEGPISQAIVRMSEDVALLARDAVRSAQSNERHRSASIIALPEGAIEELIASLQDMERRLIAEAEGDGGPRSRVYLLSLNLFPVSLYTDSAALAPQSIEVTSQGPAQLMLPETTE